MHWIQLTDLAQLNEIYTLSFSHPVLIYKHSSRCSLSSLVLQRIEGEVPPPDLHFYFLDLVRFRNISDSVAEQYAVFHESPQILLIKNGECVYEESHYSISLQEAAAFL